MIIKPSIRSNFFTNAHPIGCQKSIKNQVERISSLGKYDGPKNVLIIGGSSGYGLGSRISLAFGASANTVNVSFESAPRGKRTGSAGYWNNIFFQDEAQKTGNIHKDFLGDAFSFETKELVSKYIKENIGKIDLLVYSLASGARKNFDTGETFKSQIKTIGKSVTGKTIDIAAEKVYDLEVEPASNQEIEDTVFVMGGSDWNDWYNHLKSENLVNDGFKTIAYTYIGGPTTEGIYRKGTLGKAKEDLEKFAVEMNDELKSINGEALISSSKAVVSKASVFIPQMPIYVACLIETMKKHNVEESILEHKHRLFKNMVYGNERILDEQGRIRLDHLEMDKEIQKETLSIMNDLTDTEILEFKGTKSFLKEFYQINGFMLDDVDYNLDIDLTTLTEKYKLK